MTKRLWSKPWYKTARATKLYATEDGWFHGQYHDTVVASWNKNQLKIYSGGYKTKTTKERIMQFATKECRRHWFPTRPTWILSVWQEKYEWYVKINYHHWQCPERLPWMNVPFKEGMIIYKRRFVLTPKTCPGCMLAELAYT